MDIIIIKVHVVLHFLPKIMGSAEKTKFTMTAIWQSNSFLTLVATNS